MKTTFGAILAGVLVFGAAPALAASPAVVAPAQIPEPTPVGSLDERLGCGVMLVTLDEVLQRNPQLTAKMGQSEGGAAMAPMLRMLGASGETMLDRAYAEGATQGLTPTALYRRGVANLSAAFSGFKPGNDAQVKTQAMALFTRCVGIAAPKS